MSYATIRLALTPELKTIFESLKQDFPLMKEPDLIKMAISSFYTNYCQKNVNLPRHAVHAESDLRERRRIVAKELVRANNLVSAMWDHEPPRQTPSQAEIDAHIF